MKIDGAMNKAQRAKAKRRFELWLKEHPGGRFSDYYVSRVLKKLHVRKEHPTLGRHYRLKTPEDTNSVLEYLKGDGLEPSHKVVDYGCGSLRLGRHFIQFLEPEHYWGVDVSEEFFRMGLEGIDPDLVAERKPRLGAISPEQLAEIRADGPDYVFAMGVLFHVPPEELTLFFNEICSVAHEGTRIYIACMFAKTEVQVSWSTWLFEQKAMSRLLRKMDIAHEFRILRTMPFKATKITVDRGWLVLSPGERSAPNR